MGFLAGVIKMETILLRLTTAHLFYRQDAQPKRREILLETEVERRTFHVCFAGSYMKEI